MADNNESDGGKMNREEYQKMNGMDRCDWCGKPVDLDGGCWRATPANFGNEQISREDAVDAIANTMEFYEDPKNQALAKTFREKQGFVLHDDCYQESALSDMPRQD